MSQLPPWPSVQHRVLCSSRAHAYFGFMSLLLLCIICLLFIFLAFSFFVCFARRSRARAPLTRLHFVILSCPCYYHAPPLCSSRAHTPFVVLSCPPRSSRAHAPLVFLSCPRSSRAPLDHTHTPLVCLSHSSLLLLPPRVPLAPTFLSRSIRTLLTCSYRTYPVCGVCERVCF